jgi:Arc/MetJ-type ribon-helix-helix transcriptional regulator
MKMTITFSLDTEADRDILRWMERQSNRSEAIRAAIRAHISSGVTLGDVYQAVRDVERKLQAGVVVSNNGGNQATEWDEPPEAAAALDALANL